MGYPSIRWHQLDYNGSKLMSKITLADLVNLQNETSAVTNINSNNAILETASDNTLSRDGSAPNQMLANLDMNNNRIINLPAPLGANEPFRLADFLALNNSTGTTIISSGSVLTLTSNSPGTIGPSIVYNHNSASPALGDLIGSLNFFGNNDALASKLYGVIGAQIFTPTAGSEGSYLSMQFLYNGSLRTDGVLFGYHSGTALEHIFHWYDNVAPFLYLESSNPNGQGAQTVWWLDKNAVIGDKPGSLVFDGRNSVGTYTNG